jgi:hypothetical protein
MEERELLGVFLETGHFPAIPVGLTKLPGLAYMSLVDFVPDTPPYKFLTVVELEPANGGVQVMMTVDSMHDQVWTESSSGPGRGNELDNLATLVQSRR